MPTRAAILDILAVSQTQVLAFFQGLSPEDLERPVTTSELPGAAPWCARDHFAHVVKSERNIQRLLRHALAGDSRDALLRLQYPPGIEIPERPRNLSEQTPDEIQQFVLAVADLNQTYVEEHYGDSLAQITADYLAARQDTLALLQQFTDDQLAMSVPAVVGDTTAGDLFAGRAEHAAIHITWIEEGFRQGVGHSTG